MAKKPRIVIIGAGMAGLTAANKLYTHSNNAFDLSVVEGGSRIGGRINTSEFSAEKIEMGATWIHGIGGSPIYKIAEETGSLVSEEPWECMDSTVDKARTFAEGGFEIEPPIVESVSGLFSALMELAQGKEIDDDGGDLGENYEIATRFYSSVNGLNGSSVGSFLRSGFEAYWASVSKAENGVEGCGTWSRRSLEEAIFTMFSNTQRTYTSADDLYTLDYAAESEYQMFPGEEITIAKGYLSVIHHLASVLPQGVVELNRRVTKIEWESNEEDPVKLHFSDGSVVFADHVIVTVSLGVLKAGIESDDGEGGLFSPPLPEFKSDAIKRLGYGVVNKLFVEVSQRRFPSLQLVFEKEDSEYRFVKIPWWMRRTATIAPIHSNSKVLLSWFAGKEALELEKLTDEEIIDGVLTTVSCLTGKEVKKDNGKAPKTFTNGSLREDDDEEVVKITKVLTSKWGGDPLFRGSYSYVAVGSSGDDLDAMAEPLPQINKKSGQVNGHGQAKVHELQVMFAGEATHRTHYSTTHGAYYSGLREANRLLKHYKCDF
ncbi:PREDICTED: probable polyamine oxidase 5 [Brassica oleracea var. oleracea]|uniref:Amine oxidase domain-containing protein n=1 Tax=Brassica oleracea var. oleracea TaxID=109376 RepID=A0A0D3E2E1_BRAOL|nr:PREDICTED: probable polyamine oxidase 5 [Brassica oleracea var. oleracea]XP_013611141.1 PREDICTED: probable polyamine oxidase 5 [Brassica oleracea var. oleracea]